MMNVPQREGAVARTRSRPAGRKRRRRLLLAAMAALALLLLFNANAFDRWLPMNGFREVAPVTDLHPVVALYRDRLIAESQEVGIGIRITDGFRSAEEQDALYRQGRTAEGPIVTHVKGGQSYHNYGLAIDFALELPDGQVIWDLEYDGNGNGISDWMEVVEIAKKLGFTWGGDWEGFPDYPHLQMDFGYTIGELQRGWRPPEQLPQE